MRLSGEPRVVQGSHTKSALRSPPLLAAHDASRHCLPVISSSRVSIIRRYSVMASVDGEAAEREEVGRALELQKILLLILQQRLKSALWYSIGQFVDDALLSDDLNATPQFIGALTELVYTQIGTSRY